MIVIGKPKIEGGYAFTIGYTDGNKLIMNGAKVKVT